MSRSRTKMKENVKKLTDERDRILGEIEALKHKASGVELAISLLQREDSHAAISDTSKRGGAKALLIDLLREVGSMGLNATSAVEIAARRGVKLARGTAASNLSRMKAEKAVAYDGDKYRLPEFVRQPTLAVVVGKSS